MTLGEESCLPEDVVGTKNLKIETIKDHLISLGCNGELSSENGRFMTQQCE